ncbi:MAG: alanine racemase [Pseudomonadota bacterium]
MLTSNRAGALLTIDLDAICANWRMLCARLKSTACAAVVKADSYGLGANEVASALAAAGCKHFFAGYLHEALLLKPHLPADTAVYVLHGCPIGMEAEVIEHGLIPVLNSLQQIDAWTAHARVEGRRLPAIIQVDTGMARMGLSAAEITILSADSHRLDGIEIRYVMSHLACAERPSSPINAQQLHRFRETRKMLPKAPASLANSSGIFLDRHYHFDLARSGAALYGIAPTVNGQNPMRQVVRLQGKVLQVRSIEAGTGVGYGPTWRASSPRRIATVSVGYADGYLRNLSNTAVAYFGDTAIRLVGTVSMDTTTFDVSEIPEEAIQPGAVVDLINDRHPVDALAEEAGTIGYEILTRLGARYCRQYIQPKNRAQDSKF